MLGAGQRSPQGTVSRQVLDTYLRVERAARVRGGLELPTPSCSGS